QTPSVVVNLLFLIIIVFAVTLGLETFARAAQLFLPFILLLLFLLLTALLPLTRFENLTPIMEFGISPVLKGALTVIGIPFLDLAILLMIFPYVKDSRG